MSTTPDRAGSQARPVRSEKWRHQLRLPGQVAAPEGPADMTMMYLMHHGFRRDLSAFAAAVPRTPVDDVATWRALSRRWEVFAELLHHHHRAEDAWIWPALVARADAAEQETLRAMEAEHEQIDPLLAACATGLQRLAGGGASRDDRAALAVRVCAARECLGRHLAHEEREAIAILQRHLSAPEWEEIAARINGGRPELRLVVTAVPWLLHQLPPSVRREVVARAEPAQRLVWRLTRRRFERLERRALRHVPAGSQKPYF